MTMRSIVGRTSLGPIRSEILDDLEKEVSTPNLSTSPDWWSYLVEQGLQYLTIDTSVTTIAATVFSSTFPEVADLQTNPMTAFAVYGLQLKMNAWVTTPIAKMWAARFPVTYHAPVPPAEPGAEASITGNLWLRNQFLMVRAAQQQQFDTSGLSIAQVEYSGTRWFRRPPLIVGTDIAIGLHGQVYQGTGDEVSFQAHLDLVGKYVPIGIETYTNLVALATGQAILPPSILG